MMTFLRSFSFLIVGSFLLTSCHADTPSTTPPVTEQAVGTNPITATANSGFSQGSMNGVRLRIPNEYLFFGMYYAGENWLDPKTKRKDPPNADTPIDQFSMLLMPNFEPLRSREEWARWEASKWPVPKEARTSELSIGIKANSEKTIIKAKSYGDFIYQVIKFQTSQLDLASAGFQQNPELISGLIQWRPIEQPKIDRTVKDWYYSPDLTVLISCSRPNYQEKAYRYVSNCRQSFWIEPLSAELSVSYESDFLPRWREVRDRLTVLVESFIVPNPAP